MKKNKLKDSGFGTKKKKGLILTGELSWPDGSNYKGALKSEKEKIPHGEGVYSFPDDEQWYEEEGVKLWRGKTYFGEFKNGKFNGQGRFKCGGTEAYNYEGEFKNGLFYGKGRMEHDNGEIFEGYFKNDRKSFGKWKFSNGDEYEGKIKNNEAHGKGTFKESNGKIFKGKFKNGRGVK